MEYTFSYRYEDASVPPEYHRSYTIRVASAHIFLSVDVYGEILSEVTLKLKEAQYNSFIAALQELDIRQRTKVDDDRCVGGKTDRLEINIGQPNELKGYVYHCAQKDFGNLEGDVPAVVALFKGLIPDLQKRIRHSTYRNPLFP